VIIDYLGNSNFVGVLALRPCHAVACRYESCFSPSGEDGGYYTIFFPFFQEKKEKK